MTGDAPKISNDMAAARIAALTLRARAALLFERAWPRIVLLFVLAAAFALVAWLGTWTFAPALARMAGVGAFALAGLAIIASLLRLGVPGRLAGLTRLDRDSGVPHQPASAQSDRNLMGGPEADALWAMHRRALDAKTASLAVKAPAPGLVNRDPYALRFIVPLAAFAAAVLAGPEMMARLAAPFDWRDLPSAEVAKRIDAWIDPPHYTGEPPILLRALATYGARAKVSAPEGSTLVLRAPEPFAAKASGDLAPAEGGAPGEKRWILKGDGAVALSANGAAYSGLDVAVAPASPPTIAFDGEPIANASGSLTLSYVIGDRYGAQSAEADIALADATQGPALANPPAIALSLPSAENGLGAARTTSDLSDNPWAGAKVRITLKAVNLAGAVGVSAPKVVTLPERLFHNPLARALVEQRRDLILDPQAKRAHVDRTLHALEIAPDLFGETDGVYLGLRAVRARLGDDADAPRLKEAAELLWAIALRVEDGSSSQAQRDLRAAEKDLRDALKRGASDEEIKALTQKLREAAERYMQELAKQAPAQDQEDATLDSKDIESMLDQLENQARGGAREDAEAMLDQLQNMFENMRSARQGESKSRQAMRQSLDELQKLMRDQQQLRDDTFRSQQRERSGEDGGQDDSQSLRDRQQALQDRLDALQKKLGEMGMEQEQGFDDAGKAMGEAQGDLGQGEGQGNAPGQGKSPGKGKGDKGAAVGAQGRALQALRDGANGLQKQMQGNGQGQGQGQGEQLSQSGQGRGRGGKDPLGRNDPNGAKGGSYGRLGDTEGAAQRARRVMEELQRRLADPNRAPDERDYFERLLKRF